ncbi:MAG: methyltransferase [Oscillospiraceae bacterium]
MKVTKEMLNGKTAVYVSDTHRFGTDAMLLSHFCHLRRNESVCELGSGCGILPLRFFDGGHRGRCVAVEISPEGTELLQKSVIENKADNIIPICADLRTFKDEPMYDLVACNPPYFKGGYESLSPTRRTARHEISCTIEDVCLCAMRLLKDGGRLCLCHRPERMADVICAMRAARIEPKVIRFVRQRQAAGTPWLFLIEGQKNRASGIRYLPDLIIENDEGQQSDELTHIYNGYT